MILAGRNICSGCAACQSICPKSAIEMVADNEGFLYPHIDAAICVKCGLCQKVCPSMNQDRQREPLAVYAAKANDDELRIKSSSGGLFSLLARTVIARGGIVYGAGFDHEVWRVVHKSAENENELEDLRGAKYVQSDVQGVCAAVKEQLLAGRDVLFSGTPCQVAGLRRYLDALKVDVSKLLLVDVICHAVPSPLVWQKCLDEREAALAGGRGSAPAEGRNIRRIAFRHKNCGWKRYSLSLRFANGKEYRLDLRSDTFLRGFLAELYNRPSCHSCQVRGLRSGSDLTIADYWRVREKFPEMDDDKGTSLVLVNTKKGSLVFEAIIGVVALRESDFDDAVRVNPAIIRSPICNKKRDQFFKRFNRHNFDALVQKLLSPSIASRCIQLMRRAVDFILRRLLSRRTNPRFGGVV